MTIDLRYPIELLPAKEGCSYIIASSSPSITILPSQGEVNTVIEIKPCSGKINRKNIKIPDRVNIPQRLGDPDRYGEWRLIKWTDKKLIYRLDYI